MSDTFHLPAHGWKIRRYNEELKQASKDYDIVSWIVPSETNDSHIECYRIGDTGFERHIPESGDVLFNTQTASWIICEHQVWQGMDLHRYYYVSSEEDVFDILRKLIFPEDVTK